MRIITDVEFVKYNQIEQAIMKHVKWKDRMVFDCRLDVLNYKHHWDEFDHFELVEELYGN